ncbi:hypothetical protein FIBSPDRAFT_1039413 [Athelia psychrophila]|uniref:Uncharacterized protein n=1 Tax=Athelia psychrophila TaxID=1759441 RepID=A0A166RUC4_9AGAM|nr:hypothetical protein FIBSPDRAFT_1039413 [Fibularhizoctonia sp. CBS 109695]
MKQCLRNRIASIAVQMNEIETTRAQLLLTLEELDITLKTLQMEYVTIVNQTSPIASLPNEVLADIFATLHASNEEFFTRLHASDEEFFTEAPCSEIIVSHVTTHWRQVALGTPKLWTRIFRTSNQTLLEKIKTYLERSKISPIDLRVVIGDMDDTDSYTELIRPHMARCRHLSIDASSSGQLFVQLSLLAGQRAPFLRSLDMLCRDPFGHDVASDVLSGGAPLLTALRVTGVAVQRCLPVHALQSVTTASFPGFICTPLGAYALHHTPNLSHLRLEVWGLSDIISPPLLPIILAHLVFLSIHVNMMTGGDISAFFQALSAPCLETLFIRDVVGEDFSESWSPAKFPALHYLVINSDYIDASAIINLAVCCPYITHLNYAGIRLSNLEPILAASAFDSGVSTPTYWPNLQTLSLPNYQKGEEVLQMVLSRKIAGGRLQRLRVGMEDSSVMDRDIWQTVKNHAEVVGIYGDYFQEVLPSSWNRWGPQDR